jgi:hypothetical protein
LKGKISGKRPLGNQDIDGRIRSNKSYRKMMGI